MEEDGPRNSLLQLELNEEITSSNQFRMITSVKEKYNSIN